MKVTVEELGLDSSRQLAEIVEPRFLPVPITPTREQTNEGRAVSPIPVEVSEAEVACLNRRRAPLTDAVVSARQGDPRAQSEQ